MSILINARFLSQPITGVQRYGIEISRAIKNKYSSYRFIAPRNIINTEVADYLRPEIYSHLSGHFWEQLELPLKARGNLIINLCNTGPAFYKNQVVTIHDTAVFAAPSGYSKAFLMWYRYLLPRLCHNSRLIVTVSDFSKFELVKYCGAVSQNIAVVPNGINHIDCIKHCPNTLQKFQLGSRPFVLGVGSLHPNKNLGMFIKIADVLADKNIDFVVAGGGNSQVFANNYLGNGKVRFLGYVTDGELKSLYQNAACFVFPSLYEGFGIPPLEAMRCGCPVVASNVASLPEVCGDAALFASPDSPDMFIRQVKKVLSSVSLRNELIERGRLRSNYFTWENSARKLVNALSTLQ